VKHKERKRTDVFNLLMNMNFSENNYGKEEKNSIEVFIFESDVFLFFLDKTINNHHQQSKYIFEKNCVF